MSDLKRKVILVTGASVGLGLALAKVLIVDNRHHLILTSRSTSTYRFIEEGIRQSDNLWIRDLDVSCSDEISSLIGEINSKLGGVDILINNAGVCERSTVEDSGHGYRLNQLMVNYLGPFDIIGQVLPSMRKKRSGRIINVSSSGGFMAMPTMSAYSASKFALEAASEALWYEMRPWGISVSLVTPGFINSGGFLNTSETSRSHSSSIDTESIYYEHYRGMVALVSGNMARSNSTNETIAASILKLVNKKNPPLRVFVTLESKMLYWFRKICPPKIYHWVLFRLLPNVRLWGPHISKKGALC